MDKPLQEQALDMIPDNDPNHDWLVECVMERRRVCRLKTVNHQEDPLPVYLRECQSCGEQHILDFQARIPMLKYTHQAICPNTGQEINIQADPGFYLEE